jgi:hypothetical protein
MLLARGPGLVMWVESSPLIKKFNFVIVLQTLLSCASETPGSAETQTATARMNIDRKCMIAH